jgi:hypothetical protein
MTDQEFRKKMYELGYDSDYVDDVLRSRDEDLKSGIETPLEMFLTELPID